MVNVAVQPALHNSWMPKRDATISFGTICPVTTVGRPGIKILQMWVDMTFDLSGKLIVEGLVATHLLTTGVPSMMKIVVAPVLAMA